MYNKILFLFLFSWKQNKETYCTSLGLTIGGRFLSWRIDLWRLESILRHPKASSVRSVKTVGILLSAHTAAFPGEGPGMVHFLTQVSRFSLPRSYLASFVSVQQILGSKFSSKGSIN